MGSAAVLLPRQETGYANCTAQNIPMSLLMQNRVQQWLPNFSIYRL